MNEKSFSMTKKNLLRVIIVAVLCLTSAISTADNASREYRWGSDSKSVLKYYIKDTPHFKFSVSHMPSYHNKIMNYILAIDSNLKSNISIIRASSDPVKDYLLVNRKLYSVLEYHGTIPQNNFNSIITKLSPIYGNPTVQQDKDLTIYSFFGSNTKVITLAHKKNNNVECKIYFYASKLFKMLISD